MKTLTKSVLVEAALAGLFLAVAVAPLRADHHEKKAEGGDAPKAEKKDMGKKPAKKAATVHCLGVNACKGTSECGVEGKHGCSGQNACKGQGWISLAKKDCKKQKGTIQGAKGAHKHEHKHEHKAGEKHEHEHKTESAPAPAAK